MANPSTTRPARATSRSVTATTSTRASAGSRPSRSSPTEVFGGLTPHATRFLRQLSRVAAKHTSRDSTKYGRLARSFSEHHGQRISHAIVMTDALNICDGITKLKKRTLIQRRAA